MFQQFMGAIKEAYDDVGGFFDDLLTKETISDIIKVGATGVSEYGKQVSSSDSKGPMVDFDMTKDDNKNKDFINTLEQDYKQSKAVRAVDYKTINDEWINRLRGIATKTPYFNSLEEEEV
jgi:hypothetical protein